MLKTELIFASEKESIEPQYIFWWLGREPSQRDYDFIESMLSKVGAIVVRAGRNSIDFRIFYSRNVSMHIIIRRKYWGFAINSHIDIGIHSRTLFNREVLKLLSNVYVNLRKIRYGKCFLMPRENDSFVRFMYEGKKRWNLI